MEQNKILNEELWEMHLSRQFHWTKALRELVYEEIDLSSHKKILDVGCGIGLITREIGQVSGGEVHGLDVNPQLLKMAMKNYPEGNFHEGSMLQLPFADETFDVTFCHFVMMWVKRPKAGMTELKRVTKTGGWIVCCAEPDYGAKIDYPDEYNMVASSIRALQNEGADPYFGRRLKATFAGVGLKPKIGVFTDLWDDERMKVEFLHTWEFQLKTSQSRMMTELIKNIQDRDKEALENGERVTLLPIFWGIAKKEAEEEEMEVVS